MKMRTWTQDEAERVFSELERRLRRLESYENGALPLSAPRQPKPGMAWVDVEAGKIRVWTGDTWVSYTKD
jgi:hypothetical protein